LYHSYINCSFIHLTGSTRLFMSDCKGSGVTILCVGFVEMLLLDQVTDGHKLALNY
jgi:hypothetical protein